MKMSTTLPHSLHLPFAPLHPKSPHQSRQIHLFNCFRNRSILSTPTPTNHTRLLLTRATENGAQTDSDNTNANTNANAETEVDKLSEVGDEIKKAMKERDSGTGDGFWSGVVEEIGKIEWPEFGKVLGTTGVVLAVIAGSSVVLLTLNAVLAELSDKVFVGKGVQDFF